MQYKLLMASFVSLFMFLQPLSVSAVDLQHEATVQRLVTALETENYDRAYEILQGLRQDGTEIKGELLYYESLAALSTERDFEAFDLAEQYIEENGKEAKHYTSALEVYSAAGENADRKLAINSITSFSKASSALYINNRKTSLFNDFYKAKVKEYESFNAAHKDNKDGTITLYRAVRNESGSFDLYKWDMFACPLGQLYKNGHCEGEEREFKQDGGKATVAKRIVKDLSFAGHSDWEIPAQPNNFLFDLAIGWFDGQDYSFHYDDRDQAYYLPQQYLFNNYVQYNLVEYVKSKPTHSPRRALISNGSTLFFIPRLNEYCVKVSRIEIECTYRSYTVTPSRGPELVKSNLQHDCKEEINVRMSGYYACLTYKGANNWYPTAEL